MGEKGSQWAMALDLLQGMPVSELQADVVTSSVAILASERGAQWKIALGLLHVLLRMQSEESTIAHCLSDDRLQHNLVRVANLLRRKAVWDVAIDCDIHGGAYHIVLK